MIKALLHRHTRYSHQPIWYSGSNYIYPRSFLRSLWEHAPKVDSSVMCPCMLCNKLHCSVVLKAVSSLPSLKLLPQSDHSKTCLAKKLWSSQFRSLAFWVLYTLKRGANEVNSTLHARGITLDHRAKVKWQSLPMCNWILSSLSICRIKPNRTPYG